MRLFYVRDHAGQVIGRGKIFHDVTRQNEAEQVKKNLLAIVSHELRTPLTSIKGYATSLLETDVELDEALQRLFLRHIVEEGDRMDELVTSLLEMSQLEAGTLKLYPSLCRLDTLLEPFVAAHNLQQMRVSMPEQLPLLYIDRRRFEVVIRNLLENARRYAGSDALIEITARYEPLAAHAPDASGGLYLSIADDYLTKPFGVGELLARVRAVLRRNHWSETPPTIVAQRIGNLEINFEQRRVWRSNELVKLSPTEFGLLQELVLHPGKIFTHEALLRRVWGPEYSRESEYLRVYIGRLRRKLEDDPSKPVHIMTEPGVGYYMVK